MQERRNSSPLLKHWSYVFLALTDRYSVLSYCCRTSSKGLQTFHFISCKPICHFILTCIVNQPNDTFSHSVNQLHCMHVWLCKNKQLIFIRNKSYDFFALPQRQVNGLVQFYSISTANTQSCTNPSINRCGLCSKYHANPKDA